MTSNSPKTMPQLADIEQSFKEIAENIASIPQNSSQTLSGFLSAVQDTQTPRLAIIRLSLYAGARDKQCVTSLKKEMHDLIGKNHPLALMCEEMDTDLRVYEMNISDFNPAPQEKEQVLALTYGMMSVEEDLDLVVTGSLSTPLYNAPPQNLDQSPHEDINALIGTIFSCAAARKPVALIDENALYAASVLYNYNPKLVQNCFYAGGLNEATRPLLQKTGLFALTTEKEDFTGEVIATLLSELKSTSTQSASSA